MAVGRSGKLLGRLLSFAKPSGWSEFLILLLHTPRLCVLGDT